MQGFEVAGSVDQGVGSSLIDVSETDGQVRWMVRTIVAVSDRPNLAPIVAGWLVDEFGYPDSQTVDELTAPIVSPPRGPEDSFVLFDENR